MAKTKAALITCKKMTNFVSDDDLLIAALNQGTAYVWEWVVWSAKVDWNQFEVAIVRTPWDYTKHLEQFLLVMKQIDLSKCELINSFPLIEWNSNKSYLNDLQKVGVNIVPSVFLSEITSLNDLHKAIEKLDSTKLVVKPMVGASAHGIEILDEGRKTNMEKIVELYISSPSKWFIQPFISVINEGEISAHYFGDQHSHSVKKIPKRGDFRSQEEYGSQLIAYSPTELELAFSENILKNIDWPYLFARVDYVLMNDIPLLMELEMIEPSLYFRMDQDSPKKFVDAFLKNFE